MDAGWRCNFDVRQPKTRKFTHDKLTFESCLDNKGSKVATLEHFCRIRPLLTPIATFEWLESDFRRQNDFSSANFSENKREVVEEKVSWEVGEPFSRPLPNGLRCTAMTDHRRNGETRWTGHTVAYQGFVGAAFAVVP